MFPEKFFYAIFNPEFAKRPDLKRQIVFDDVPLAKELISGLRPRDSEIMWKYYAEGKTLSKLGVEYSVSGSRIRQIIQRNLAMLRRHLTYVYKGWPNDRVSYASYSAHLAQRDTEKNTVTRGTIFYKVKEVKSLLSRWKVRLTVKGIETAGDLMDLDEEKLFWISGVGRVGRKKIVEAQQILRDKYGL